MATYSDAELDLPERWFTGEEWGNGTAQKIYRDDYKRAVELKDPRFTPFKDRIFAFYQWRWSQECPWDGSEAGNLSKLLKACPKLDISQFSRWLYNYGQSEDIKPGERPRTFLPRIHNYSITPLNIFGRDPRHETRQTFAARDEAATDTAIARARARRIGDSPQRYARTLSDRSDQRGVQNLATNENALPESKSQGIQVVRRTRD